MESQSNIGNIILDTATNSFSTGEFKNTQLIDTSGFNKHIQKLTSEQKKFIYLLDKCLGENTNSVIVVSGSPGAGKTFTVVQTCHYLNMQVLKLAPTNALASQISGFTIHHGLNLSWGEDSKLHKITQTIKDLDPDENYLTNCLHLSKPIARYELKCAWEPTVIIIDEVGMIPFWLVYQIIQYFFQKPVVIVLMGDRYQLRPVECKYNIFNIDIPGLTPHTIDLTGNMRFTESFKATIDQLMNCIRIGEKTGNFESVYKFIEETFPQIDYMTKTLYSKCNRVLAYTNEAVNKYNCQYLELEGPKIHLPRIEMGKVYKEDCVILKHKCTVIVTEKSVVPKGTHLIFHSYKPDKVYCLYRDRLVVIPRQREGRFPLKLAFASTIHKFQGSTIDDNIIIDFNQCKDVYLMYTALSRVRSLKQIVGVMK